MNDGEFIASLGLNQTELQSGRYDTTLVDLRIALLTLASLNAKIDAYYLHVQIIYRQTMYTLPQLQEMRVKNPKWFLLFISQQDQETVETVYDYCETMERSLRLCDQIEQWAGKIDLTLPPRWFCFGQQEEDRCPVPSLAVLKAPPVTQDVSKKRGRPRKNPPTP